MAYTLGDLLRVDSAQGKFFWNLNEQVIEDIDYNNNIGLDLEENALWFDCDVNLEDDYEVDCFIENYFEYPISTFKQIQNIIIEHTTDEEN